MDLVRDLQNSTVPSQIGDTPFPFHSIFSVACHHYILSREQISAIYSFIKFSSYLLANLPIAKSITSISSNIYGQLLETERRTPFTTSHAHSLSFAGSRICLLFVIRFNWCLDLAHQMNFITYVRVFF